MSTSSAPVLVTGATGRQGGATARALLAAGVPVRALVRDPDRARAVEALGAELVVGDFDDRDSLTRAATGTRAVFSVQMPRFTGDGFDYDGEVRQAVNLMETAEAAGVPQFVQTSASGVGRQTEHPDWQDGRWPLIEASLGAKQAIEERLRATGFRHWTLLKPSFFMENLDPGMAFLFPRGVEGGLVSLLKPATMMSLVAAHDVGVAAAAAIAEPERFDRLELELASDYRSMTEIAAVLSEVLEAPLSAPDMSTEEALAAGMPLMGTGHDFLNAGQPARPEFARELGIPLTRLEDWAREHLRP
ncbi:NmrA family NAD(P)-binding protein [Solirubrobacter phytolaccae]|uniref:NmrA family NAD(P)-binding protein n=1 Tax=Solirubrobacter phytolaccae TaxID=1404360 RepID=A0A9X3S834_9ACTN|nr:NmrA family NAD(P)-binding protein [Solirubrobacter phytolaccae]MDA0179826.1 NmrA family NAD(P)-binding protein [Solirubrobacter phytolaccae]